MSRVQTLRKHPVSKQASLAILLRLAKINMYLFIIAVWALLLACSLNVGVPVI